MHTRENYLITKQKRRVSVFFVLTTRSQRQGLLKVIALNTFSADDADPAEHRDDVAADFKNKFYKSDMLWPLKINLNAKTLKIVN